MYEEKVRVLLVEDNPRDVEIIRRMLGNYQRARFEVHSADTAEQGLEQLGTDEFDVILLDYMLPGQDGLRFLARVGDDPDVPPVIMLTAQGDERVAAQAMSLGAYDYFPKSSIVSEILAQAIHQALEKYRLNNQLEGAEQVIFTLAAAVEAKDPLTVNHLVRMASYAVQLGKALDLDEGQLVLLRHGAILHYIGKIGVRETILHKPGPLSKDEWKEMKEHPVIGETICAPLRFSHNVGPIIRHHHERWDGRGYPAALAGEQIPFLARVISVIDAFDAMTSDRPYRDALSVEEATSRLDAGAGNQWDPDIMQTFLEIVKQGGPGVRRFTAVS